MPPQGLSLLTSLAEGLRRRGWAATRGRGEGVGGGQWFSPHPRGPPPGLRERSFPRNQGTEDKQPPKASSLPKPSFRISKTG